MIVLNWIFCNGHSWSKSFETVDQAENYAHFLKLFQNRSIDKSWIDTQNEQIWLKEKND